MALRRFSSSRGRLVAILAAVMIPIGTLLAVAAWSNYRITVSEIDRDYDLLTSNLTTRLRVWIRGSERSLAMTAASLAALPASADCDRSAGQVVQSVVGLQSLYLQFADGRHCRFAQTPSAAAQASAALQDQAPLGVPLNFGGERSPNSRMHFNVMGNERAIGLIMTSPSGAKVAWRAYQGIDPGSLTSVLGAGAPYPQATIAAVLKNGSILSAVGASAEAGGWFPNGDMQGTARRWASAGSDGVSRIYASRPAVEDALYIVGGFSSREVDRARWHFTVLLALPLLVLASLAIVFVRAIDLYVVRWLSRIAFAARERSQLRPARVRISASMPTEIRDFSLAFNDMAQAEETRRAALERALNDNQFLIRELHHRVKNSLQVIQSYIAIESRDKTGEARAVLVDAELRVKILSIAYRIAMADGVIRAVELSDFISQIVQPLSAHLTPGQVVQAGTAMPSVPLELEKVIALGYLIADVVFRSARAQKTFSLTLHLVSDGKEDGLDVIADRPLTLGPEARISRGLTLQLGAVPVVRSDLLLAGWRWPRT